MGQRFSSERLTLVCFHDADLESKTGNVSQVKETQPQCLGLMIQSSSTCLLSKTLYMIQPFNINY